MFRMEPRGDLIHFEHDGVQYSMTGEEIWAAYNQQKKMFLIQDAERHFYEFVFGGDPVAMDDDDVMDDIQNFELINGVAYSDALGAVEQFVNRFEKDFDCNMDENSAWECAIVNVLFDMKQNRK